MADVSCYSRHVVHAFLTRFGRELMGTRIDTDDALFLVRFVSPEAFPRVWTRMSLSTFRIVWRSLAVRHLHIDRYHDTWFMDVASHVDNLTIQMDGLNGIQFVGTGRRSVRSLFVESTTRRRIDARILILLERILDLRHVHLRGRMFAAEPVLRALMQNFKDTLQNTSVHLT